MVIRNPIAVSVTTSQTHTYPQQQVRIPAVQVNVHVLSTEHSITCLNQYTLYIYMYRTVVEKHLHLHVHVSYDHLLEF